MNLLAIVPETSKLRPPKLRVPPPLFLLGQALTLTLSLCSLISKMGLTIPVPSQHCCQIEWRVKSVKLAMC